MHDVNSFSCTCAAGYTGPLCDVGESGSDILLVAGESRGFFSILSTSHFLPSQILTNAAVTLARMVPRVCMMSTASRVHVLLGSLDHSVTLVS